jgi:hypothetical protein
MSFASINSILETKLATVAGLPVVQAENTLYKPANTPSWCRTTLLPAATVVESIGTDGRERKNGLFQVDLFYINNSGYTAAMSMADLIIATFTKGIYLNDTSFTVMVLRSYMDSAKPFPNYYQLPVIVEWECFV